jgi:hypothetical protein
MLEWGALLIPLLATGITLVLWRRHLVWWELTIPVAACVVFIAVARFGAEYLVTGDTEYWGSYATGAEYYEAWTEVVEDEEEDEEGNVSKHTHTTHHDPEWYILDNVDQKLECSQGAFDELASKWGNREHEELSHSDEHGTDGDKYVTTYDGSPANFVPLTTEHRYTNRVRVSKSVFRQYKGQAGSVQVYDYPSVTDYYQPSVIGAGKGQEQATALLDVYNARQGAEKEVRLFLLVFPGGDVNTGMAQESYWEGGNKNEVVVCVGVNQGKITWCYPFTWSEVDLMKVKMRQEVMDLQEADLLCVAQKMVKLVDQMFVRKHFREFAYVSVTLPRWSVVTIYILTLAVTVGTLMWVCNNQFGEETGAWKPRYGRTSYNRFAGYR